MFHFEKIERLGIITLDKSPANSYEVNFFNEFEQLLKTVENDPEMTLYKLELFLSTNKLLEIFKDIILVIKHLVTLVKMEFMV